MSGLENNTNIEKQEIVSLLKNKIEIEAADLFVKKLANKQEQKYTHTKLKELFRSFCIQERSRYKDETAFNILFPLMNFSPDVTTVDRKKTEVKYYLGSRNCLMKDVSMYCSSESGINNEYLDINIKKSAQALDMNILIGYIKGHPQYEDIKDIFEWSSIEHDFEDASPISFDKLVRLENNSKFTKYTAKEKKYDQIISDININTPIQGIRSLFPVLKDKEVTLGLLSVIEKKLVGNDEYKVGNDEYYIVNLSKPEVLEAVIAINHILNKHEKRGFWYTLKQTIRNWFPSDKEKHNARAIRSQNWFDNWGNAQAEIEQLLERKTDKIVAWDFVFSDESSPHMERKNEYIKKWAEFVKEQKSNPQEGPAIT